MVKIITPENVITEVLATKTKDFRLKLYETKLQKITFIGSVASVLIGLFAGVGFRYSSVEWLGWIALFGVIISSILALAYQVAQLIPEVVKLKNPEKEASSPLVKNFNSDMELIHFLSSTFEAHHLSYAKAMYGNNAKHIRERIGLLVGALDKVGIIPISVTSYLSYTKAIQDGVNFGLYEGIGVAFVFLYIFAMRMSAAVQWMEDISELYGHAYAVRMGKV